MSASALRTSRLRARIVPAKWWLRRQLSRWLFERRLDVDTEGAYSQAQPFGDANYLWHQPSPWLSLRIGLRGYEITADDVFVDLGSGKGRVVLQAACRYRFKRVIGVELSPELNEVARANIEANRDRLKCREVQLETADLTEYQLPDDVTIAYFFNSVTGAPFTTLVAALLNSLDRRPRRLTFIYPNPTEHDRIIATGRARVLHQYRRNPLRDHPLHVYELTAAAQAGG